MDFVRGVAAGGRFTMTKGRGECVGRYKCSSGAQSFAMAMGLWNVIILAVLRAAAACVGEGWLEKEEKPGGRTIILTRLEPSCTPEFVCSQSNEMPSKHSLLSPQCPSDERSSKLTDQPVNQPTNKKQTSRIFRIRFHENIMLTE